MIQLLKLCTFLDPRFNFNDEATKENAVVQAVALGKSVHLKTKMLVRLNIFIFIILVKLGCTTISAKDLLYSCIVES